MRTVRTGFGLAIAALGLLIVLFPFITVWRASAQALEQLPEISGEEFSDQRHRIGALFDHEMTLARRTYPNVAAEDIELRLATAGFQSQRTADHRWHTKECCGEWDAVWARAEDRSEGGAVVVVTMYDSDIQASWGVFLLLGLPIFLVGIGLSSFGALRRSEETINPQEPVSL